MQTYYVVVPPGFETLAMLELEEKLPGLHITAKEKGGFYVQAPKEAGELLNVLKIPTRVLMRLHEGRYRDFPKFFKAMKKLPWKDWSSGAAGFHVTASRSRLNNEKRLEKTVRQAMAEAGVSAVSSGDESQTFFHLRNHHDTVTLSMEVGGGDTYKRGYKIMEGVAPIRENLAAGLFYSVRECIGDFDTVIDPFCGTGTMLLEAQSFYWTSRKDIAAVSTDLENFYAFDQDAGSLQLLRTNLKNLERSFDRKSGEWVIARRDVLANEPVDIKGHRKVVITNAPYGKRVKLPLPPAKFYRDLLEACERFDPSAVGLIFPRRLARHVPKRLDRFSESLDLHFANGGLPVTFRLYA